MAGLACGYLDTDTKTTHLTHFRTAWVCTLLHYDAHIKVPSVANVLLLLLLFLFILSSSSSNNTIVYGPSVV